MTFTKHTLRILIYFVCVIILGIGIVYTHTKVQFLWKEVAVQQAVLEDVPAQISQTAALKKELDGALVAMQAISKTVPTEDEIVDIIAAVSDEVIASGVSAQVPVVGAKLNDQEAPSDDNFSEVRIHVVASGAVDDLASFLYRVEHLPYILRVVFWKIDTVQQTTVTSFTETAPSALSKVKRTPGSSLEAEISVLTKKKDILP